MEGPGQAQAPTRPVAPHLRVCGRPRPESSVLCWALSRLKRPHRLQEGSGRCDPRGGDKVPGVWPPPSPQAPLTPSLLPQVPDAGALSRACGFIQQLHVAYSTLASGLQGLPAEFQQRVAWARRSLCELYGLISSAGSGSELPAERLAQSRAGVVQAWRGLEQLVESVQHGPPLSWLVGPFALHPNGQQL